MVTGIFFLFFGIYLVSIVIIFVISYAFYEYKLYIFDMYKRTVSKLMRKMFKNNKTLNSLNDEDKMYGAYNYHSSDGELSDRFKTFFSDPISFISLLLHKVVYMRFSKQFSVKIIVDKCLTPSIEDYFVKNNVPWVKPFKKALIKKYNKIIYSFGFRSAFSYGEKISRISHCIQYDNKSTIIIKLKIILHFLTWFFKNFFVILQQNKKNNIKKYYHGRK